MNKETTGFHMKYGSSVLEKKVTFPEFSNFARDRGRKFKKTCFFSLYFFENKQRNHGVSQHIWLLIFET